MKTQLFLFGFLVCLLTAAYLGWSAMMAENTYFEGNELCESESESLRQMCEDDYSEWQFYEAAWKVTIGLAVACLLGAVFSRNKPANDLL